MQCRQCKEELNNINWLTSQKNKNSYICKFCTRADNNKRYQNKKIQYLNTIKYRYYTIKKSIFDHYGGKCELCFESNYDKLSLDHIHKNGRKHRKSVLKTDSGTQFYKWVYKNKPKNIRLLCYNCNCQHSMNRFILSINNLDYLNNKKCKYCNSPSHVKKYICNICHAKLKHNYQINLKYQAYNAYNNCCNNCGCSKLEFLTVDHINDDGSQHRKTVYNIYSWLKLNNYPKNNFQILCFNCNYLKQFK